MVADAKAILSKDDGKSWKTFGDADQTSTLMFSNIFTAPVELMEKIVKGEFTTQEEKINGEEVVHLEGVVKGKEPPKDFWLCREPEMKNMVFLRKVALTISGEDMELPAVITYSELTKPVRVTAPKQK